MFDSVSQRRILEDSLDRLERWIETHNYKGYEPFDGLSSWFRPLTFGNLTLERILLQSIRQSPINLRPIAGVQAKDSTKGRGYMACGYLNRYRSTGDNAYLQKAEACLDWLDRNKARKFLHHSWSNHFDFSSRGGSYTKDDPIIVWTALIGFAYVAAYRETQNSRWLEIADSACRWIMDLPRERTSTGSCLSYLATVQSSIHNSNLLGAAMLAQTAKCTDNQAYLDVARSAVEYSCSCQLSDGSWWYGEAPKYRWVDNFHTGYNLSSLKYYMEASGDHEWQAHVTKGLAYYKSNFFQEDGCPKYYNNRLYPIDIQCAAQSIETLAEFSEDDSDCMNLSIQVARWTIKNMQARDGHFFYRIYPVMKARTPMLHWGQATMYKALSFLVRCLVHQPVEAIS